MLHKPLYTCTVLIFWSKTFCARAGANANGHVNAQAAAAHDTRSGQHHQRHHPLHWWPGLSPPPLSAMATLLSAPSRTIITDLGVSAAISNYALL